MTPFPRALQRYERASLANHFLALSPKDRVLRFGAAVSEYAVRDYVRRIDFDRDVVFGVLDARGELIGAGHLARNRAFAELGLSVLPGNRRLGIGSALVSASCLRCHEWGVTELFMQCAATNVAMRNLAHKHGMRVLLDGSEVDAFLPVPYRHLTGQTRPVAPALG